MAVRKILLYPESKEELRRKSGVVDEITPEVRRMIQDLKDTLNANSDGIGLAAPQINIHKRIMIACVGEEINAEWVAGSQRVFINPKIIKEADPRKDFDGCLSFPGLFGHTIRPHSIQVLYMDENGCSHDEDFEGFNAVVIHHEIDHLEGLLFIDRVETLDDLYTLHQDEEGKWVKEPFNPSLWS